MNSLKANNPLNLNIQFRHMDSSTAMEQVIHDSTAKLLRFGAQRGSCEVVIDETHHWNKGGVFNVSVRLKIPGQKLLIATAQAENTSPDYLHAAIHTAFDDMERQLKKQRRKIRRHTAVPLAA